MVEKIPAQSAPADLIATSIVLAGAFDPMHLQPSYLAENDLLSEGDLAQVGYQILAPEIGVLTLPWMQVIVEPTKLMATTTLESPLVEPVRDFVFSFYDTLKVRHVTAIGFNHDTHFAVRSEEVWHKVGHQLVPKEGLWRTVLVEPGTASVMIRGKRDDKLAGHVNVKVEPSLRLHPGIYVNVNDHIELGELDSDRLVSTAGENLESSKKRSDAIIVALKGLAE
jgi:hypothetical protein